TGSDSESARGRGAAAEILHCETTNENSLYFAEEEAVTLGFVSGGEDHTFDGTYRQELDAVLFAARNIHGSIVGSGANQNGRPGRGAFHRFLDRCHRSWALRAIVVDEDYALGRRQPGKGPGER